MFLDHALILLAQVPWSSGVVILFSFHVLLSTVETLRMSLPSMSKVILIWEIMQATEGTPLSLNFPSKLLSLVMALLTFHVTFNIPEWAHLLAVRQVVKIYVWLAGMIILCLMRTFMTTSTFNTKGKRSDIIWEQQILNILRTVSRRRPGEVYCETTGFSGLMLIVNSSLNLGNSGRTTTRTISWTCDLSILASQRIFSTGLGVPQCSVLQIEHG